jgi:alpha-beta hydrolase superfamily lysophospholipase
MTRSTIRPALALIAVLLLAACAPLVQRAGQPELGFAGPRLEDHAFIAADGAEIAMQTWLPADGREPWAVIVGAHGMNDYSNAFHLAAPFWAADGIATYAYDQRGFGRSPQRGVWGGDALMTEDLRTITALVRQRYPHAVIAVAGVSMGGAIAIEAFASDRPPAADRLVLLAPAVWGWSSQPLPYKTALWLTAHVAPGSVVEPPRFVTSTIRASDNDDELRRMGRDPLMIWGARTDTLYGLVSTMERAWAQIGRVKAPIFYLSGKHDQIIPREPMLQAAGHLKPTDRSVYYGAGYHLLLVDKQAETVWRDVESYLRDPAAPLPSGAPKIPGAPTPSNGPAAPDPTAKAAP